MRIRPCSITFLMLVVGAVAPEREAVAQAFRIQPSATQAGVPGFGKDSEGLWRFRTRATAPATGTASTIVRLAIQTPKPARPDRHELDGISIRLGSGQPVPLTLTAADKTSLQFEKDVELRDINNNAGEKSPAITVIAIASYIVKPTLREAVTAATTALANAQGASDEDKQKLRITLDDAKAAVKTAVDTLPAPLASLPLPVVIDNRPPVINRPEVTNSVGDTIELRVPLDDTDLALDSLTPTTFTVAIQAMTSAGTAADVPVRVLATPKLSVDLRAVELEVAGMGAGRYTIAAAALADIVGNKVASIGAIPFDVPLGPSPAERGKQIEFPDFLGRSGVPNAGFNPDEKVETRVVRLYYYRDAHRVVQIINRNTRQLNRSGVDFANNQAVKARDKADDAEQERKLQEMKAIRAVQRAREARHAIDQAEATVRRNELVKAKLGSRQTQLEAAVKAESEKPVGRRDEQKQQSLQDELDLIPAQLSNLESSTQAAQTKLNQAQQDLSAAQVEEVNTSQRLMVDQSNEDRARADQFRKEVIAGTTDPDSYAAAKTESIDPVAQTSVTVVGEGMIHLRGPVRGINKIARMIHQLDTPVGQVKIGIHTVQVNGEHGDRMELVYERIDKHIAHSRFLSHESLQMFRKAVLMVASEVAASVDGGYIPPGCEELAGEMHGPLSAESRNWRYVHAFFGRDFIAELKEMDSELLKYDNKLLSLHSMDVISLSGALYVAAVAENSIRLRILSTFLGLVQGELPNKEVDYYRALTRIRHPDPCVNGLIMAKCGHKLDAKDAKMIWEKACRTYQFSNFVGFFDGQLAGEGTLNSVQQATIRLAQALKAQLVAELEFKNLVLERSLMERTQGAITQELYDASSLALQAKESRDRALKLQQAVRSQVMSIIGTEIARIPAVAEQSLTTILSDPTPAAAEHATDSEVLDIRAELMSRSTKDPVAGVEARKQLKLAFGPLGPDDPAAARKTVREKVKRYIDSLTRHLRDEGVRSRIADSIINVMNAHSTDDMSLREIAARNIDLVLDSIEMNFNDEGRSRNVPREVSDAWEAFISGRAEKLSPNYSIGLVLVDLYDREIGQVEGQVSSILDQLKELQSVEAKAKAATAQLKLAIDAQNAAAAKEFAKRILEQSIDDAEEKSVELLEAMRSHVANVDNYLKRLATAIEDDIQAQFYNPAFQDIRRASRFWDVNLGQIETTTILTNNRAFAKVSPSATMEFDLPQRDILITEAMKGSKALATEYGNLLKDPTFVAGAALLGGQTAGLNTQQSPLQKIPSEYGGEQKEFGAALQALIPDPAVYRFETGTGFQIRPVIQPDGHSIVYGFDYMYTTNVREPVRADEKHLGRVKRHFIHTDVQTSSYELREVSKYMVALKASRTAKGVPLFEDVPLIGGLFRPLPSQESSLQQNIILASSVIYPTLYDLMGLRWSPYADELQSAGLAQQKLREKEIGHRYRDNLLRKARASVNENIGGDLQLPAEFRTQYQEPPAPAERVSPGPRLGPEATPYVPLAPEEIAPGPQRAPEGVLPGAGGLESKRKPLSRRRPMAATAPRELTVPGKARLSNAEGELEDAERASLTSQPKTGPAPQRDRAIQQANYEEPAASVPVNPPKGSSKPKFRSGPMTGSGPVRRR